ncbi:RNA 2',3'-cyclic phosphodiesterase [Candidatus Woesearchaeota archaeon]|nr:RNA 2',3'-cyclic phosphodiesterase [Candidatus Woesearchaeota archaeon]
MRLFIALDAAVTECQRLQALLPDKGLTKTKEYHVTLKFLGEVTPEKISDVKAALGQIQHKAFTVMTTHVGVFPSGKNIRVIWLGVEHSDGLTALQKAIDNALHPLGFPHEKNFHAHITLARVKFADANLHEKIRQLAAKKIEIPVKEFILYKSTLTPLGPVHEALLKVPLID